MLKQKSLVKKKSRKLPHTPYSKIKAALTQLFTRSRERAAALKRDGYACVDCNIKQSKAKGREVKVQVDHIEGKDIADLVEYIRKHLLCDPSKLETVCIPCHERRTEMRKAIGE